MNGQVTVDPGWDSFVPSACQQDLEAENYCKKCDCYHIGGLFSRMDLAASVEFLMNGIADGTLTVRRVKNSE